jgi:hypothetical protein
MTNETIQPRAAIAALLLCAGFAQHVQAQEQPATAPEATEPPAPAEYAAPAEASPGEVSAAPAPAAAPLDTIPVREDPATGALKYPYDYAAVRVRHADYDDYAVDGFGIEGSYLVAPNWFAIGRYAMGQTDATVASDTSEAELGLGYRQAIWYGMDANGSVRLVKSNLDNGTATNDELGYRAEAGVRYEAMDRLEVAGGLIFADVDYRSDHAYATASAYYRVMKQLGVGAEAIVGSSSLTYGLVGRWSF